MITRYWFFRTWFIRDASGLLSKGMTSHFPSQLEVSPLPARHWWTVVHHPEMAGWCTMALQEIHVFAKAQAWEEDGSIFISPLRTVETVKKKGNTTRSQANILEGCTAGVFLYPFVNPAVVLFPRTILFHLYFILPSKSQLPFMTKLWTNTMLQSKVTREENEDAWFHIFTSQLNACISKCYVFMMRCQETRQETISRIDGGGQTPIMTLDFYIDVWCSWTSRIFRCHSQASCFWFKIL